MYFRGKGECDFIVQEGSRPAEAWQVCWEINRLTYNQEGTRTLDGAKILLIPVWKWLLKA
jgi:predicted AAA+ superfamily ATPase